MPYLVVKQLPWAIPTAVPGSVLDCLFYAGDTDLCMKVHDFQTAYVADLPNVEPQI